MAACSTTPEPGHGQGEETFSPTRVVPLVEARRNAIQLELKIQSLLTQEYGVGQWNPPQKKGIPQVSASSTVTCPDEYVTESWDFATAGPIKDSQWRNAVERVYTILKPLGYDKPAMRQIRNDHITVFPHPDTGGRVEIRYDKATVIIVNTGCAKGGEWEGWPDGTEVLPEHLRTTGRAPIDLDHEIWPTAAPPSDSGQPQTPGSPSAPQTNGNTPAPSLRTASPGQAGLSTGKANLTSSRFPYIP